MQVIYEYAAKVVCGESEGDVVAPGHYWTAVNIHNPHDERVKFRKKVAVGLPGCKAGPVTALTPAELGPDEALEIDCKDILEMVGGLTFVKGFAVIRSPRPLDVVAVYTAGHEGPDERVGVSTMDVERVPPRRMEVDPSG